MNTHMDQLAEWWENAEKGSPDAGDTVIASNAHGAYTVYVANHRDASIHVRILHRAPAPKPAWHDAVAVIASTDSNDPQVWVLCGEYWDGTAGGEARTGDLIDPVPLIEQKVTAAAVRAVDALLAHHGMPTSEATATAVTRAALGLDPA